MYSCPIRINLFYVILYLYKHDSMFVSDCVTLTGSVSALQGESRERGGGQRRTHCEGRHDRSL